MKKTVKNRPLRGFSLIELMTVVVIIGVLGSVALPAFMKYVKKSKTTEAILNLRKIYDGEHAYYMEERVDSLGTLISKQFVQAPMTPDTVPGANKTIANFSDSTWAALRFNVDSPVFYSYATDASGTGTAAMFTARAMGDLDGDGQTSLFERLGSIDLNTGGLVGGPAVYMLNELN